MNSLGTVSSTRTDSFVWRILVSTAHDSLGQMQTMWEQLTISWLISFYPAPIYPLLITVTRRFSFNLPLLNYNHSVTSCRWFILQNKRHTISGRVFINIRQFSSIISQNKFSLTILQKQSRPERKEYFYKIFDFLFCVKLFLWSLFTNMILFYFYKNRTSVFY